MDIINNIVNEWLKEENQIKIELENDLLTLNGVIQKSEELKLRNNFLSDNAKKFLLIKDIYAFMDFIDVNRDALSFELIECDNNELSLIENQQKIIEVEKEKLQKEIETYQLYLQIIRNIKNNKTDFIDLRKQNVHYITKYELIIDMYLLNNIAISRYNNSPYQDYEFRTYIEVINSFSIDNVKAVYHPIDDEVLTSGVLDYALAICRVSWELQYLKKLIDKIRLYNKQSDITALNYLKNNEKGNPVISRWKIDTRIIEDELHKYNEYFEFSKNKLLECRNSISAECSDNDTLVVNEIMNGDSFSDEKRDVNRNSIENKNYKEKNEGKFIRIFAVIAIFAILIISIRSIIASKPTIEKTKEAETRDLSIGEQLMAQAEERNKIIAEREAELEEKHRQEEANIKMVTLAMEVPFNRMKMGERNYAYFIPENSRAQNTKGNTYTNALALWKSIGIEQVFKATIYLDDVYEKFSCVVGCYQNTNSEFSVGKTGEHLFEIYLNAQPEPAFSTMISYDSEPIKVELDLKGIYYITFKYGEGENDQKGAIVGDGKLYKTIEVSEKEVEDYLGRTDIFYRIQNTTSE